MAKGRFGQVIDTKSVVEASVRSARIYQMRETELADIAKSLKLWSINDPQRRRVETDCVPKRVPKNLFWA